VGRGDMTSYPAVKGGQLLSDCNWRLTNELPCNCIHSKQFDFPLVGDLETDVQKYFNFQNKNGNALVPIA
jgi:hypothetical protein